MTPGVRALLTEITAPSSPMMDHYAWLNWVQSCAAAILAAEKPAGKTVRVRAGVAVDAAGDWAVAGWSYNDPGDELFEQDAKEMLDDDAKLCAWITADVPAPEVPEIAASVEGVP